MATKKGASPAVMNLARQRLAAARKSRAIKQLPPVGGVPVPPIDEVTADVERSDERIVLTLAMQPKHLQTLRLVLMGFTGGTKDDEDQAWKIHDAIAEACDESGIVLD